MKIISCDCFEERGLEVQINNSCNSFNLVVFKRTYKDGVAYGKYKSVLKNISNCPYCGKKIEVKEE